METGRTEDATSMAKPNRDEAEFVLRHAKWMDEVESMDISVTWRNAASPPPGRDKMTMYRD